uniref:Variant surface glycoprotein 1059 n=1 Tax=Trypanosoma brucei TaxID=5691 RepID=M4TAN8_9TRYP|nr:variant surface glycoprotein 1059 [Trypanosoma brucei]
MRRRLQMHELERRIAAILVVFLGTLATAQSTDPGSLAAVTSTCAEIYFNKKLAEHFSTNIQESRQRLSDLNTETRMFFLAATPATDKQAKMLYTALSAIAADAAIKQQEALKEKASTIEDAVEALQKRNGILGQLLTGRTKTIRATEKAQWTKTNQHWLSGNGRNEGKCVVTYATTGETDDACDNMAAYKDAIDKVGDEITELKQLALTPDSELNPIQLSFDIHMQGSTGSVSANGATGPGYCGAASTAPGSITNGVGAKPTATPQALKQPVKQTLGKTGTDDTNCANEEEPRKLVITDKAVLNKVCEGKKALIKPEAKATSLTRKQIAKGTPAAKIAFLLTKGSVPETAADADWKAAITAVYGPDTTDINKEFIEPLKDDKIMYNVGSTNADPDIVGVSNAANFGEAIAVVFWKGNSRQQQAKPKTTTESKTTEKCKPDTEATKCKEDKDCEHKEGKCKLKAGMKAEEKKEKKCTGKEQKECEKATDCK